MEDRAKDVGEFIVATKCTIRETAKYFGVSKSTIHKDTKTLCKINPALAKDVASILEEHASIKHIRGGEATRRKFLRQ